MRLSEFGSHKMLDVLRVKEIALGGLNDIGGREAFCFAGIRLSKHPNQIVRFSLCVPKIKKEARGRVEVNRYAKTSCGLKVMTMETINVRIE